MGVHCGEAFYFVFIGKKTNEIAITDINAMEPV